MDKYCMCEKIGLVARDGKSTCMQCGGIDAYGSDGRRKILKIDMLSEAKAISTKAHMGQSRWSGLPYITHPEAVANSFEDNEVDCKIAAWLHDVVEDTGVSLTELHEKGFSPIVLDAIALVTKKEGENYADFIMWIAKSDNLVAKKVKLADLKHNMSDLKEGSMKDKYRLATLLIETFIKRG